MCFAFPEVPRYSPCVSFTPTSRARLLNTCFFMPVSDPFLSTGRGAWDLGRPHNYQSIEPATPGCADAAAGWLHGMASHCKQSRCLGVPLPYSVAREHWPIDRCVGESEGHRGSRHSEHQLPALSRLGSFHKNNGARPD